VLLFQKNFGQPVSGDINPFPFMTDVEILAENTFHIAIRKKHSSCAVLAGKTGFFPPVKRNKGNAHQAAGAAETVYTGGTVRSAPPRTEITGLQVHFAYSPLLEQE
jgi:hypothetical protein